MSPKLVLFNTLGRKEMEFVPIEPGKVRLYTCGPTVYDYAHVGNLRTYLFEDVLKRTLLRFGYEVTQAMNITDVGHLTSDADTGEDKMIVGARRTGRSPWELARFYEKEFFENLEELNVLFPEIICRATEHIPEMIEFIERLCQRDYAYVGGGNVYFAVDRFPRYGEMALLKLDSQLAGARVDVDPSKQKPFDFVLWFTESKFPDQEMKWDSPWGVGFPGWHIECSAMATKYLGERIDIHCGGIDHIPVHHTNEIAQSEAALGHEWVNYWMHGEFLVLKKGKMSKSSGSFLTLAELLRHNFSAMDYRFLCLGTHYRHSLEFSWEAMQSAQNALERLQNHYLGWVDEPSDAGGERRDEYRESFDAAIANDLNMPQALAVVWKVAKDPDMGGSHKRELLLDFDSVLGLGVEGWRRRELSEELQELLQLRAEARHRRKFAEADELRERLLAAGVAVKDTPTGTQWYFLHGTARGQKEKA